MNSNNPVNGSTYLVLGILSLVLCPLLGPVAWSMSNNALSVLDQYEAQTGDISQRGLVVAGRICGIIGTALFGLSLFLILLRGCAMSGQNNSSRSGYSQQDNATITVDGRPATPQERQMIEQANQDAIQKEAVQKSESQKHSVKSGQPSLGTPE